MEIIPGLPEDLWMQCLVRVPYRYHCNLRAVCRSWNALLSCQHFYQQRQRHGVQCEEGVVSLCESKETENKCDFDVVIYYPLAQWWERLPHIPAEFKLRYREDHRCVFVRSRKQLVVVGLFNRRSYRDGVLIFDFLSRRWWLGTDVPFTRNFFVCAASASEGLVYFAGSYIPMGYSSDYQRLEAFVYNVEENKWDFLPPPDYISFASLYFCASVFLDGKFYVAPHRCERAQVYDPHTRVWKNLNSDSNADYIHSCVAARHGIECSTWYESVRGWIDVKEIDIGSNSQSRSAGRFAIARSSDFLVSVVQCSSDCVEVEYYSFNPRAREARNRWRSIVLSVVQCCSNWVEPYSFNRRAREERAARWRRISLPNNRFIFSSRSVQI
ncbi:F-box/kelch-repeat protein At1g80440-like [Cryptomeria japonica]|uniref:F-box/kelch-repeat protein At1g80440-like n=1 Tax=Cryptomeria japonica TaxID=3369 RepID=UPI0027DA7111|nr:F-box/kelch-repeat protein At1g80440-like [Cryptomeria japonica]